MNIASIDSESFRDFAGQVVRIENAEAAAGFDEPEQVATTRTGDIPERS
jgi:hypothetical protein